MVYEIDVPSGVCVQVVQLRPTILAIVFIRNLVILDDSNASTMLPDTAAVTRDEEAASVFGLESGGSESFAQWWAWIFLLATYTSCDFLLIADVVVGINGVL